MEALGLTMLQLLRMQLAKQWHICFGDDKCLLPIESLVKDPNHITTYQRVRVKPNQLVASPRLLPERNIFDATTGMVVVVGDDGSSNNSSYFPQAAQIEYLSLKK